MVPAADLYRAAVVLKVTLDHDAVLVLDDHLVGFAQHHRGAHHQRQLGRTSVQHDLTFRHDLDLFAAVHEDQALGHLAAGALVADDHRELAVDEVTCQQVVAFGLERVDALVEGHVVLCTGQSGLTCRGQADTVQLHVQ